MARILFAILLVLGLASCGSNHKLDKLNVYLDEINNTPVRQPPPVPAIKPYHSYHYSVTAIRSPFKKPLREAKQFSNVRPDVKRKKEELENYTLDAIRMVGTMMVKKKRWALLLTPNSKVHKVTLGNFVGKDYGEIIAIDAKGLKLREIVTNSAGGWRKQERSILLTKRVTNK